MPRNQELEFPALCEALQAMLSDMIAYADRAATDTLGDATAAEVLIEGGRRRAGDRYREPVEALPTGAAGVLLGGGGPDEAGHVWRDHGLPCGESELLDLERRSWRTMETLSCARVRLLAEQGKCGAAEALASSLCTVASEHGLTRTLLRGLALSMDVAHRAGQPDRALERLVDFLRTVRGTGYTRPLVRHRAVSRTVLGRFLSTDPDEELRATAESMLTTMGGSASSDHQLFSRHELDVLAEAARGLRGKEMGGRLGISYEGVRYHLKNIYRKAGVSKRADAIEYAQSLGILT